MEPARIPLARVKRVMKEDPEVLAVSNDAVQHMAAAIQLFVSHFTEQALMASRAEGRNRLGYKDFAQVASEYDEMAFLGPFVPKTVPFNSVKDKKQVEEMKDNGAIPFPRREELIEADEEDVSD